MKKLFFLTIVFFVSISSNAQKIKGDIVKLDLGILNKLRVGYEHRLPNSETISYGGVADFYYGSFPGIKLEPFGRYYIGGECPEGLYGQARFLFGYFSKEFLYYYDGLMSYDFDVISKKTSFASVGGGLDIGYQWLSGKRKNIVVDISLGVQVMPHDELKLTQNGREYYTVDLGYNTTGPGAVFNPHIMIGYKF